MLADRREPLDPLELLELVAVRIQAKERLADAAMAALEGLCTATRWPQGELWLVDELTGVHTPLAVWAEPGDTEALAFSEHTRSLRFSADDGLPALAASAGEPVYVTSLAGEARYLRHDAARDAGFTSAVVFPLRTTAGPVGAMAFHLRRVGVRDEPSIRILDRISRLLSKFIRLRREQALLREANAAIAELHSATRTGTWRIDARTGAVELSPPLLALLGFRPGETPSLETALARVAAVDRDRTGALVRRAMETGEPYQLDQEIILPDGRRGWLHARGHAVRDEDGTIIAVNGSSQDITDRVEREQANVALAEALRQSEQTFREAFTYSAIGIALVAPDGRFLDVNPSLCTIVGYSRDELLARTFTDITHPDDINADWDQARMLFEGVQPSYQMRKRYFRKDGRIVWVRLTVSVVRAADGRVAHAVAQIEDISMEVAAEQAREALAAERQQLAAELLRAQKMESLGRMAGGVAHDFNNVLTIIRGTGELLRQDPSLNADLRADVTDMLAAADRAAALTRRLLAFGSKQAVEPRPLDLNIQVGDLLPLLRKALASSSTLLTALEPGLPSVLFDPGQLDQVILNLVVNARDAMPLDGHVAIRTSRVQLGEPRTIGAQRLTEGEWLCLDVTDNGTGFSAEAREHLFEPFFTTKAPGAGTGLGLASIYGVMRQAHGAVEVGNGEQGGARVTLWFPPFRDRRHEHDGANRRADRAVPPVARADRRLLLVDDEPGVRRVLARLLARQGYQVIEAESGEAALARFREAPRAFGLVLTDMAMPGLNGRELAELLLAERPDLPIIYMSGFTEEEIVRSGELPARRAFLQKPFTADHLLHALGRLIAA